jgi:aryl-alcohol dehydrogenase-like predicted oxidoreductase
LLGSALDAGLNVIDTAECYADSEEKIGRAVGKRRNDFHLFTKCGHTWQRLQLTIGTRRCCNSASTAA